MELHPDDRDELLNGSSPVEMWRRSEHATEVSAELMRLHGGTVPMSELLWLGAESFLPRQWQAGRVTDPKAAAAEVYERWRRLEQRRLKKRQETPDQDQ